MYTYRHKSPIHELHQWLSGSALKTGRWEMPSSIPGLTCRSSLLDFSVVFSETRLNTGWVPLERPPQKALQWKPGLTNGQSALIRQSNPTENTNRVCMRNF